MGDKIEAGMRVVVGANSDSVGAPGRVVELGRGDQRGDALVAFDDGSRSKWVKLAELEHKIGRTPGSGVRVPKDARPIGIERRFSEVLKTEMARLNLTWEALAERSGVSRATIARILADNAEGQRIDTIEALAGALGIAPGKFWEVTTP